MPQNFLLKTTLRKNDQNHRYIKILGKLNKEGLNPRDTWLSQCCFKR